VDHPDRTEVLLILLQYSEGDEIVEKASGITPGSLST
jgi:hypothetical protein